MTLPHLNLTTFARMRSREYDARDYLAGDGVTDDTAALQSILTAIDTDSENATIYFDNATYILAGALQDTGRRNAQILLPTVAINEISVHGAVYWAQCTCMFAFRL